MFGVVVNIAVSLLFGVWLFYYYPFDKWNLPPLSYFIHVGSELHKGFEQCF